jgi:hypothetical protein
MELRINKKKIVKAKQRRSATQSFLQNVNLFSGKPAVLANHIREMRVPADLA